MSPLSRMRKRGRLKTWWQQSLTKSDKWQLDVRPALPRGLPYWILLCWLPPTPHRKANWVLTTSSPNKLVLMSRNHTATQNFKSLFSQATGSQAQLADFQMYTSASVELASTCGPSKINPLSCLQKPKGNVLPQWAGNAIILEVCKELFFLTVKKISIHEENFRKGIKYKDIYF